MKRLLVLLALIVLTANNIVLGCIGFVLWFAIEFFIDIVEKALADIADLKTMWPMEEDDE